MNTGATVYVLWNVDTNNKVPNLVVEKSGIRTKGSMSDKKTKTWKASMKEEETFKEIYEKRCEYENFKC